MKNKMNSNLLIFLFLIILAFVVYSVWQRGVQAPVFTCRAHIVSEVATKTCDKTSVFDIFLSINEKDKGYILISGNYSCPNAEPTPVEGVIDFTYSKEGDYYSIYMGGRGDKFSDVSSVLKYGNLKMKITNLDHGVYMLSLPNDILMMCTKA